MTNTRNLPFHHMAEEGPPSALKSFLQSLLVMNSFLFWFFQLFQEVDPIRQIIRPIVLQSSEMFLFADGLFTTSSATM